MGALVKVSGNAAVLGAGHSTSPAIARGITDLMVAYQVGNQQSDGDRRSSVRVYAQAVADYEEFISAFVLWRACVRAPDARFAPRPAQIEELCNATRNALRTALLRTCLCGEGWYVGSKDLPDRWFGEYAAAPPFTPGSLVPDDAAYRWVREYVAGTVNIDELRKVRDWTFRDYRSGYSYLPDYLRRGWSPAAIGKLPDAALPDGFRTAYEAAIARLSQLRQEEVEEREKEAAAMQERRLAKYGTES